MQSFDYNVIASEFIKKYSLISDVHTKCIDYNINRTCTWKFEGSSIGSYQR